MCSLYDTVIDYILHGYWSKYHTILTATTIMTSERNIINNNKAMLLGLFILAVFSTGSTSAIIRPRVISAAPCNHQPNGHLSCLASTSYSRTAPFCLALWFRVRGGSDESEERPPSSNKKKKKQTSTEIDSSDLEDDWQDAPEEEIMQDDEEEEDYTDDEAPEGAGLNLQQGADAKWLAEEEPGEESDDPYEAEESEDLDDFQDAVQAGEEVGLAEVLLDQQQQQAEEEDFVDALEDDIQLVASTSYVNTDDESSSANVDRDDLADAYDVEEEEESVLVMGGDDDDEHENFGATSVSAQGISPGGGDDDDSAIDEEIDSAIEEASAELETALEEAVEDAVDAAMEEVEEEVAAVAAEKAIIDEINEETKQILIKELRWTKREVKFMRPDIAAVVAYKSLMRPREGMPVSWYTEGNAPKTNAFTKVLKTAVVPICFGAAVLFAGQEFGIDACSDILDNFSLPKLPSLPKPPKLPILQQSKTEDEPSEIQTAEVDVDSADEDGTMHQEASEDIIEESHSSHDNHAHSVKPYSQTVDDEPDQTALDKVLTKIESAIKAILQKEF